MQVAAREDMSVTREGSECLNIRCFPLSDLTYLYGGPVISSVTSSLGPCNAGHNPEDNHNSVRTNTACR